MIKNLEPHLNRGGNRSHWLSAFLQVLVVGFGASVWVFGDTPVAEEPKQVKLSPVPSSVTAAVTVDDKTAIQFSGQTYFALQLNLDDANLELFWKDSNRTNYGGFDQLKNALEKQSKHLVFATNAGMFNPEREPVGLHVEYGKALRPINTRNDFPGNFYLMPNGVFFVAKDNAPGIVETANFSKKSIGKLKLATQSGPMLVINSKIHSAFNPQSTSRYIRSGVGISGGKNVVFAISAKPVTFYEFASLFLDHFKCPDALYLDGAISHFHAPEFGHRDPGSNFGGILAVSRHQ